MDFFRFISLSDPNVRYVVLGVILLTASSAVVGCFTLLRKRALSGDVIAHSVLPGICLAFILSGEKNIVILLAGAFVTGWLSLFLMDNIVQRSRIKEDTALGLILSVFFGIGVLLLTSIQHGNYANQAGLDSFLFGKAAALSGSDIYVFTGIALAILLVVFFFYKELTLISFDKNYAKAIGFPVRLIELVLTSLTVLAVVVGIQAVGVVLMAAMLITPAAAARFWTNRLPLMLLLAALFAAFSGIAGAYVSYAWENMPTGPWIVVTVSVLAILSFIFAPDKGLVTRMQRRYTLRLRILEENILKAFFHLGEKDQDFFSPRSIGNVLDRRLFPVSLLRSGLRRLKRHGYLEKEGELYKVTNEGLKRGQRIARLHRLWELYLTEYLNIAPDHVHEDAENMEHFLTPEIEQRLEQILKNPTQDPHATEIPRS